MDSKKKTNINIVTGGVNTGKTTRLLTIYNKIGRGDGFINKKIYEAGQYKGQKIVRLSTGESEIFSLKKPFLPVQWDEEYSNITYSFSRRGFDLANRIVEDIIKNNTEPVFIDEIGPLELQEKGFYQLFRDILVLNKEIYVSVRDTCLEGVIDKFRLENKDMFKYSVIYV